MEINMGPQGASLIPNLSDDVALLCLSRVARVELPKLQFVCKAWRGLCESKDFWDLRQKIASTEAWIYVKPSDSPFRAFSPQLNKWFELPQMLRSSNGSSLQGFACVAVGAKLLVMGGIYQTNDNDKGTQGFSTVSSGDVHVYNACTNRWSRASSMKTPRSWFAAAVVGDFVYVAGGQGRDCFLNSVEVYDSTKDVWSYVPNMACVRSSCSAFAVNGKVWVIGGEVVRNQYGERPERGSAEVYDPQLGIWKLIPEMWLDTKKVPSPGTVHCGKMLFVYQNKLMMYDEITNKWHRIGYSSGGDAFNNHFSRFGFACESIDEELYIIGGFKVSKQYGSSLQALNTTEVSKVSLEQPSKYTSWRRMANMGTDKGSVLASAVLSS